MKHLDDEDIARFVDGHVDEDEREVFLEHFSECDRCLKAYTETIKFVDEEERRKYIVKFPIPGKMLNYNYKLLFAFFTQKKVYITALAILIVFIVTFPYIRNKIHDNKMLSKKIQYIEEGIKKMEKAEKYAFSPSKDKNKVNAAIRTGFFIEDLHLLLQSSQKEELKTKIIGGVAKELKSIFADEAKSLLAELEIIKKKDFKRMNKKMQTMLEHQSLSEPYQFGRFMERSILSGFEDKRPGKKEIEKYLAIAEKNDLPPGVLKDLKRLKDTPGLNKNLEICQDIKEVFLGTR
jgi:predicted transposase YbfD/YdcC